MKHIIITATVAFMTAAFAQSNPFRELPPPPPPEVIPNVITDTLDPPPLVDIGSPPELPMPGALSALPPVITIPLEPVVLPLTKRLPLTIPTQNPTPQAPQHEPPRDMTIISRPTPPITVIAEVAPPASEQDEPTTDTLETPLTVEEAPLPDITTLAYSRGANKTALLRLGNETLLVRDQEIILAWGVKVTITDDGVTFQPAP